MSLETSKMIYQQQKVAAMIAGRMTKSKGTEHSVYKVPTGFQVVAVTKLKSGMPPAKPLPVIKPVPVSLKVPTGDAVVIDLKFRGEGNVYVDAWLADGKPVSFGKTTLLGWEIKGDRVLLSMTKSMAKKRGLLAA